jgi:hydroxymethylglutaryl-CoA reductase
MNGIDAVTIATGNDFRAVEAGAHSFASFERPYTSLTKYERDGEGNLVGSIELPIAVGSVGGATRTNPVARVAMKILGVKTAQELAQIMASVGLAQNFAALRVLASEGIQRGHMRLHAKNIAVTAGATGGFIDKVSERMVKEGDVSVANAEKILKELSS